MTDFFICFLSNLRLGFTDYLTVEELASIFPELDYVDHRKRDVLMVHEMNIYLFNSYNIRPLELGL